MVGRQQKLEVRYQGSIEFTDDDSDVKTMSPGALVRIRESGWLSTPCGRVQSRCVGDDRTSLFGRSALKSHSCLTGKAWLSQILPKVIRQTGFGAASRVARILKAKGPAGVLAEIDLIEGSWAKRIYFTELLKTAARRRDGARRCSTRPDGRSTRTSSWPAC